MFYLKQLNKAYKQLFTKENESGKIVLKDLFSFCNMDKSTFVEGDPYSSAYNEGMRRVYLRIAGMLRMDEEYINDLMKDVRGRDDNNGR